MGLFCHVGEMEVGREGPHEIDHLLQIELSQHCPQPCSCGLVAIRPARLREETDLFDEFEQLVPVLPCQGVAELSSEPPNVGSEVIFTNAV